MLLPNAHRSLLVFARPFLLPCVPWGWKQPYMRIAHALPLQTQPQPLPPSTVPQIVHIWAI